MPFSFRLLSLLVGFIGGIYAIVVFIGQGRALWAVATGVLLVLLAAMVFLNPPKVPENSAPQESSENGFVFKDDFDDDEVKGFYD